MYIQIEKDKKLTGLGGWLILVAISLIIRLIDTSLIFFEVVNVFNFPLDQISDNLAISSNTLFVALLIQSIGNMLLVIFTLYVIYLFFKKDYRTPRYFILLCLLALVLTAIDLMFAHYVNNVQSIALGYKLLWSKLIYCVIWIPYFVRSVRVKNTFVNNKPSEAEINRIVM